MRQLRTTFRAATGVTFLALVTLVAAPKGSAQSQACGVAQVDATKGIDRYVSPSGNDRNDGTASRPWRTIQHAAEKAGPAMVVHVAGGEYNETIRSKASGAPNGRVVFVSDTKWAAKIISKAGDISDAWKNDGDYVTIACFDVTGDGHIGINNRGSHVIIYGNNVHDIPAWNTGANGGGGIDNSNYSASDNDVIGNVVHDIAQGADRGSADFHRGNGVHGIYHANYGGHIQNNTVYRAKAWGILLWHAATNVAITSNLLYENGNIALNGKPQGGGLCVGAGDSPGGVTADHVIVTKNVIRENKGWGIRELGSTGANNVYQDNQVFSNFPGLDVKLLTGTAKRVLGPGSFAETQSAGAGQ